MNSPAPEYTGKHPPKILIVDDKPANLVALEKVLKNVDAELVRAASGNEALKQTLEHEFALALLDVQMPQMDGYELAEIMRTDEHTAGIPIIFISAIYTDRLNMFKGYEKGAFSFIAKPFEPVELLNKVRFFIDKYHTEKAFEDSRLKYMDLYNSSPDMLVSIDIATNEITECNQTLLRNTGYSREEVVGKNIYELYHHHSLGKVKTAFKEFHKTGKLRNVELAIGTKEGSKIDVLLTAEGILDIDGRMIKSNSSLRDISELKKTREELELALQKLKFHNEELENFVYLTSHDLQEPMLTVMSFIKLLEEQYGEKLDKEAKQYIRYCAHAAGRMKELVTCLLDYLRVGHDNTTDKVKLNRLVNEVVDQMQGSIRAAGAEVNIARLPMLNVNESDIKRLFQNLISNAIKFRKPGVIPVVHIDAKKEGDWWVLSVKDNGIGIDPGKYKKVFQMFQQLHTRGKYEGMGVGMSICKKIVEYYGGNIWIESEEGKGTQFYFKLPAIK